MKAISILGSTGSIGRQTLDVVTSLPERFRVVGLAAGNNLDELAGQIARHRPQVVSVADARTRRANCANACAPLPTSRCLKFTGAVTACLSLRRIRTWRSVVSAAVGVVGLEATYAAVRMGKQVALSNKEVLVAAGELVMAAAAAAGVELLPVDSEHNAIHQCLRAGRPGEVRQLILTASGGPFRKTPLAQIAEATPEQALAHPNWRMGNRITIDSATLVNKGFEVIEARWLFGMPPEQISVVIHPQSTIHSMVEYVDGSILAQLGPRTCACPSNMR